MYEKIEKPGRQETCTYICKDDSGNPQDCTEDQLRKVSDCENIPFKNENQYKKDCQDLGCDYFAERTPKQTALQNQERYLIVDQNYDGTLFS